MGMGTNYYWQRDVCDHCGRGDDRIHIGKSSGGWCFAMHVYPGDDPCRCESSPVIESLQDWEALWQEPKSRIQDEYGRDVTVEEMRAEVTERGWSTPKKETDEEKRRFYRENQAQPGPNGLARCQISPGHCIAHGEGTWDYLVSDFS